jgi:hypothetical protein
MKITDEDLINWFTYHAPRSDQLPRYQRIRDAARTLATVIRDSCPGSADTTAALRKLREAVMTANASIACEEEPR